METIRLGSKENSVRELQTLLEITADGNFGPKTDLAVKQFQKLNGLTPDGIVGQRTWQLLLQGKRVYSTGRIAAAIRRKKYIWYVDKLNIVGIRNSSTGDTVTNLFDDHITVSLFDGIDWKYYEWEATTDPGRKGVLEFKNPKGVANLKAGQWIDSYGIGLHKGRYTALRQIRPVTVYRDDNKDLFYDKNKTDTGLFGINIHKAGIDSTLVENWSEGCQVFKREVDFNEFMRICIDSKQPEFTYTLLESTDIL